MTIRTRRMIVGTGLASMARMSAGQVGAGVWLTIATIGFLGCENGSLLTIAFNMANMTMATINIKRSWKNIKV